MNIMPLVCYFEKLKINIKIIANVDDMCRMLLTWLLKINGRKVQTTTARCYNRHWLKSIRHTENDLELRVLITCLLALQLS